nr:hypothetical protein [Gemmatimonadaceae bacterium]
AGVALVTGSEAEIASGAVSRDELLAMLRAGAVAPARTPHDGADAQLRRTRVRLLVATDVASEGLSLAGARTVVHLDEPWTPARLLQRTGRAARIGAPVERVRVVRLAPPATRDEYARVERVLARKAGRLVHVDALMRRTRSDDTLAAITRIARRWSTPAIARRPQAACGVAVRADARRDAGPRDADEWLVALQVGRGTHVRTVVRLVARTGEVRRAGLRAWRRADLAPRPPDATYAAAAPAWLGHVIAGWWALRDDPLDRRASVTAERPHPPLRDAPALARIRGALDAAIDGAAPLERHACARGAERVRQRLRGGVPAALLARWAARAGDEARCRRWLVARGRHVASGARDRRVHAAPVIVAAIPLDARRGPTGTA